MSNLSTCREVGDNNVMTCEGRISFPHLFEPAANKFNPSAKPKYEVTLLLPPGSDTDLLKKIVREAAKEKFGSKTAGIRIPMKLAEEQLTMDGEPRYPGFEGWTVIKAVSIRRPAIVDAETVPLDDPERVYSGVWARIIVNTYAYSNGSNRGVSFGLSAVQILRDDEKIGGGGGGRNLANAFDAVDAPSTKPSSNDLNDIL